LQRYGNSNYTILDIEMNGTKCFEEQRERETIEIQREFLQEYCRLYGLEVAEMYADDGLSGTPFYCTKSPTADDSWKMLRRTDSRQCSSPS